MALAQHKAFGALGAAFEQLFVKFPDCTFNFTPVILDDCFLPKIRSIGVPAFGVGFKVLVRMNLGQDCEAAPTEKAVATRTMHFITAFRLLDRILALGTAPSALAHIN